MHKRLRQRLPTFLLDSDPLTVITAPLLYVGIVPIAVLDAWVSVYQHICFRVYGVARVRRAAYVVFNRQHLRYLNGIEKVNCAYCSYATGVFAYVREVAGRTEEYWCPIRHAQRLRGPHTRITASSSSTVTRRGTKGACRSCGSILRKEKSE